MPAFATLVSEPLLILADSAIVGHLSTASLAGLGIAANLLTLLVGLSVFLAYSTTATVSRRLGAGDLTGALARGQDGMVLGLLVGLGLAVGLSALAGPLTGLYATDPTVHAEATRYLHVAACGLPGVLVMLASTGVLRGLQDTRTPLYVTVSANLANIGLNLLLVYPVGLGIVGSATGTAVSQLAAGGFLAWRVRVTAARAGVPWQVRPARVLQTAREGGWLVLRTAELQLAITSTTVVAAGLGAATLAAHQVVTGLWSLLALALDAVAIAGQAIVGRWLGAGDTVRARRLAGRMIVWGMLAGLAFGVVLVALRHVYVGLFTPDPAVQALIVAALLVFAVVAPINGVVFVLDGVLIGAGDARYLALAGLVAVAAYLPIVLSVHLTGAGLTWLWAGYGCYMVARLIVLVVRFRGSAWMRTGA